MNTLTIQSRTSTVVAGIVGLAVGDALGVPVEFESRTSLDRDPVTSMREFGTHNQPAGTWSDDTSLTLCLAESLCETGVDFHDQAQRFVGWLMRAEWTPHGRVFDVGHTTSDAIFALDSGVEPTAAGPTSEFSCGNGSLMRILPVAFYLAYAEPQQRIHTAMQCSRLTHGHVRCQLACALFVEVAASIVRGRTIEDAVEMAQTQLKEIIESRYATELKPFERLLSPGIEQHDRSKISGSGYVIDCLEASLWCAIRAKDYSEGVLEAVNLGDDTDTTGAVAGALLGLRFGIGGIPAPWIDSLARKNDILALANRFATECQTKWELQR